MTIKTKFNPHQKVWRMYRGKAKESTIQSVEAFSASGVSSIISYWVDQCNVEGNKVGESELFATKNALLKSL